MADPANTEPDLPSLMGSPPQKRKRGAPDSPQDSRQTKRADAPMSAIDSPDLTGAAFMESALVTAQAAVAGVNVSDFNALQQAASGEHSDAADPANASSTAAAALVYPTIHIPQTTEEAFAAQAAIGGYIPERSQDLDQQQHHLDDPYGPNAVRGNGNVMINGIPSHPAMQTNGMHHEPRYSPSAAQQKPTVGSEEWHKLRKDNHKEVERRRRETINEGINELAKIVPGCEKNKGSILQRAVSFITQLKEAEQQNIEKWTLEKLLTEQAIGELSSSNDKLKSELDRVYGELDMWRRAAMDAGASVPDGKADSGSIS